jgi:hypothetical protein
VTSRMAKNIADSNNHTVAVPPFRGVTTYAW